MFTAISQELPIFLRQFARLPWRKVFGVLLALSGIGYFAFASDYTTSLFAKTPAERAALLVEEGIKNNPKVRDKVAELRDKYSDIAIASKMKLDNEAVNQQLPVETLDEQIAHGNIYPELDLLTVLEKNSTALSPEAKENFLETGELLVASFPEIEMKQEMIRLLGEASPSAGEWNIKGGGPESLLIWSSVHDDKALWNQYLKEQSWLGPAIMTTILMEGLPEFKGEESIDGPDPLERVRSLVRTAAKYPDILLQVRTEYEEHMFQVLRILETHGETVRLAKDMYRLDPAAVMEVIAANPQYFAAETTDTVGTDKRAKLEADFLYEIYGKTQVWVHAQTMPFAVDFFRAAPEYANEILERYGSEHKSLLMELYSEYGPESDDEASRHLLKNAAEAISKDKDIALAVLAQFKDDNTFKEILARDEVGWRAVRFAATHPDQVQYLATDSRWVDKYFNKDGSSVDSEHWWEFIPGASLLKIATNLADGVPNSSSELGWAAYDAADAVLTILTLGSSKAVTTGIKAGAKVTSRSVAKKVVMRIPKLAVAIEHTARPLGKVSRVTLTVIKSIHGYDVLAKLGRAGKVSIEHIATLAKENRRIIAGTAAATMAFYKVYARRALIAKAPDQISEAVGDAMARTAKALSQMPGKVLAQIFQELLDAEIGKLVGGRAVHLAISIFFLVIAVRLVFYGRKSALNPA